MTTLGNLVTKTALAAALIGSALPASAATSANTSGAACSVRNAQAHLGAVVPASLPTIAAIEGLSGTALVRVNLDQTGAMHAPAIVESSGSETLDRAALVSATEQNFHSEIRDCQAVEGSYTVVVEFAK